MATTLDLDDIQHFLLARTPALAARYEFLGFDTPEAGRTWLSGLVDKVGTGRSVGSSSPDARWVTIAFTCNGLRALGIDEASLASFPEEFRQGMAARADMLGFTGNNRPEQWLGDLANPALHAIVVLFARDVAERDRCERQHRDYLATLTGVTVLSTLNLEALPPFDGVAREHFGYRDRLSQPVIADTGEHPTPGSGPAVKAGEFFLGYEDESGVVPPLPHPQRLTQNGSFLAYLRMEEHVAVFREFLRQQAETADQQELVAAKLMGRWRSGAPLTLCPEKDDPALGGDLQRTNDFLYKDADPLGYRCPIGSHIRRMNPRDTAENMQRRKMIRRGGTYGPKLPEGAADDGVERGIAAFIGCASLIRQFEFAMNVWVNDPKFKDLDNERDPICGTHDGTFGMTFPKRPIRKRIQGLPAFTTIRGGAYFFLPGVRALRLLASGQTSHAS
jgi:Dyp-type peroxidase family